MTKAEIAKKYIAENPNETDSMLANKMRIEYPGMWRNYEAARSIIKYYKGTSGEKNRKYLKDKTNVKEVKPETNAILKKIGESYTNQELQAIASGGRIMPGFAKVPVINFNGKHFCIGAFTDTHIGSSYFREERVYQAFEEFTKQKVDFIAHAGDVTEGMSNRPGQIYELDQLGYHAQRAKCVEVLSQWNGKMYMISGNHDRWYLKSNGANIVQDIAQMLPDAEFLGHDEGDISLNGKATLKLWHGEDGSSYAVSYRIQKVIESLSGGEKPSVMFFGHTHKSTYLFERNVHCYSLGCIESQSGWMRAKRLSAHVGFWIIDIWVNNEGVSKAQGCFHPFYT
jgi:predicted phosphodiesterase